METQQSAFSLFELFQLGGAFMWPLLFFSIATVAISLERAIYIFYHDLKLQDLEEEFKACLKENNIAALEEYLESLTTRRVGARILLALARKNKLSENQMEKAVESEAMSNINSLENGFNFLIALGSISPLTGFLGTVSGMIGAFRSIAEATEVNAQIVANGIYEALITTVFGLIIAIVAMVAHSVLTHVVDKFSADVEKTCSELIAELATMNAEREKKAREIEREREMERERERARFREREMERHVEEDLRVTHVVIPQITQKPTQADIISLEEYS
jgi:biopolymer transport protein ExbB